MATVTVPKKRHKLPKPQSAKQNARRPVPPVEHRFPPGVSGNPAGRPAAGASVKEWWNQMADWPLSKVTEVMNDEDAPAAKRAAARVWHHACSSKTNAAGSPIAGPDLDRIIDHTHGKPVQSITGEDGGPLKIVVEYVDRENRAS